MKKEYKIIASYKTLLTATITAESQEQAESIAAGMDGADFAEIDDGCNDSWNIESVTMQGEALADSIAIVWAVDDVQQVRPDLTKDQAREVLRLVKKSHDANNGVTWETLEAASVALFGDAPESEGEP